MPQDMAAKESRMKIALVEVDVFLQQRAVDDAYELGLTNNNTSSELIPTTSSHPERSLEQLKWARLSLLLLLELMGVRKEQDCKINSGRQFSGFFRLVDHARLSKVILSPFRGMLRLVTHDARKLLYYLTPPQQTPLPLPPDPASDDAILYVLRDFRRNLLFRVGTNEFIGYDQLH
jgi:hypothetical protein